MLTFFWQISPEREVNSLKKCSLHINFVTIEELSQFLMVQDYRNHFLDWLLSFSLFPLIKIRNYCLNVLKIERLSFIDIFDGSLENFLNNLSKLHVHFPVLCMESFSFFLVLYFLNTIFRRHSDAFKKTQNNMLIDFKAYKILARKCVKNEDQNKSVFLLIIILISFQ